MITYDVTSLARVTTVQSPPDARPIPHDGTNPSLHAALEVAHTLSDGSYLLSEREGDFFASTVFHVSRDRGEVHVWWDTAHAFARFEDPISHLTSGWRQYDPRGKPYA